ncbi:hypothetical protein TcasGA2_TC003164 [Tribolium castaneum]|uniref:Uncharacterized protein n=1 Tax=Tribolium castaneum TaxID=7070 RepID=D6WEW0_TRICA|nr:hypothetical protein TcasGA2_TC003164 [Tribolium castaneum]
MFDSGRRPGWATAGYAISPLFTISHNGKHLNIEIGPLRQFRQQSGAAKLGGKDGGDVRCNDATRDKKCTFYAIFNDVIRRSSRISIAHLVTCIIPFAYRNILLRWLGLNKSQSGFNEISRWYQCDGDKERQFFN